MQFYKLVYILKYLYKGGLTHLPEKANAFRGRTGQGQIDNP